MVPKKSILAITKLLPLVIAIIGFEVLGYAENINAGIHTINVTSYTFLKGSLPDYITCTVQDSDGFIWIGTHIGLFKFDSYSFQPVPLNEKNGQQKNIREFYKDSEGNIWIITNDGLFLYDIQEGTVEPVFFKEGNYDVLSVHQQDSSVFWLGTTSGELVRYDRKRNTTESFFAPKQSPLKTILPASEDLLFIAYVDNGTVHFDTERKEFTFTGIDRRLAEHTVQSAIYSDFNNIIIGSDKGIYKVTKDEQLINLDLSYADEQDEQFPFILSMLELNDSILLIGTDGHGILSYNFRKKQTVSVGINSEYPIYAITSLSRASRGEVWIGTTNAGLHVYDPFKTNFLYWGYEKGNPTGISASSVLGLSELDNGNILVALDGGGVNLLIKEERKFLHYEELSKDMNVVNAILEDNNQNIWVGTHWKGLKLFKFTKDNQLINKKLPFNLDGSIIKSLYEDRRGNIWIGSGSRYVVYKYNPAQNTLKDFDLSSRATVISCFREDSDSTIWLGGVGGLLKYRPSVDKIEKVVLGNPGSALVHVTSIMETTENKLWIGSNTGLWCMNQTRHDTVCYTVNDGLPSNKINGLVNDNKGNLWISTEKGLSVFDTESETFRNLEYDDGIIGHFNENATLKASDGNLYFGSTSGIYCFNPEELKTNPYEPPVFLTSLSVKKDKAEKKIKDDALVINLKNRDEVSLSFNQNTFTIDFVALNYTLPSKNTYKYRLQGFDKDWIEMENSHQVTYTNIPSGDYMFTVKAANNDGVWNETGKSLKINILPPWYRTSWAFAIWTVLLLTLIFIVNSYILLQIRLKDALKLERAGKEKQNEINQNKLRFFTNITHDLRSPLTLIMGPLEKLIRSTRANSAQHKQLLLIRKNADRLLKLIDQILEFRKVEHGTKQPKISRHDIVSVINNLHQSFMELAHEKNIRFSFHSRFEKMYLWVDADMIEKIFLNLLSNAFKFTPEYGKIDIGIDFDKESNKAAIIVKDTGKGINKNDLTYIFDSFYQSPDDSEGGTGIGLALVKSLVEIQHGTISVESEPGEGSTFTVGFRLGKSHFLPNDFVAVADAPKTPELSDISVSQHEQDQLFRSTLDKEFSVEKQYTVLVVEDENDLRQFIRGELSEFFHVHEAKDGEEGYAKAVKLNPDLIVSDILMQPMSGLEMCRKVKTNFDTSHIPVILLTALTSEEQQVKGLETGADDYITKPFNISVLLLKIRNLLETRQKLIVRFKTGALMEPAEIAPTSTDESFLNDAIDIIREHISDPSFKVDQLIAGLGMSRSPFFRKIKAITGLSPHGFIQTIKLKQAAQLLVKSQMNISEVAFETGFVSLKHFRACFKKQYGLTPTDYIQQQRDNIEANQHNFAVSKK